VPTEIDFGVVLGHHLPQFRSHTCRCVQSVSCILLQICNRISQIKIPTIIKYVANKIDDTGVIFL
jgi:hypothetical protein